MQARLHTQIDCALGEGPIWALDRLFFFDILGADLHAVAADGTGLQSWHVGRMASAAARTAGRELVIATETGLVAFDPQTDAARDLIAIEADRPETRSNDGRADHQGGLWISTMGKAAEPGAGALYRYLRGTLRCLRQGMTIPNAICFAPDGRRAYFADSAEGTIYAWALDPEGWPLGAPAVLHRITRPGWAPDGAVVDADGTLWVAIWGGARVLQITPDGIARGHVDLPVPQPSCPAFGPDGALYITTARQGLDADALDRAPLSGSLFVTTIVPDGLEEPEVLLP